MKSDIVQPNKATRFRWYLQIPWATLKIAIYLLVAYSIIFTVAVTYGIYRVYDYASEQVESVQTLNELSPIKTSFMRYYEERLPEKYPDDLGLWKLKHRFVPMDSISKNLKNSVIAVEDASFYQHPGVHLESIIHAIETNKRRRKKAHGGSTISQQLAKNIFLTPEKTMVRKGKELLYTLMMERWLGKERILELYLNYAQFGKNIFGCEAAAQYYFKKSCAKLTFNQSVQLASILANPSKYLPGQRGSRILSQRRRIIYENLYATRKLSLESFQAITGDNPRQVKEKAFRESIQAINHGQSIKNGEPSKQHESSN
jgi:monofunctional glycosyltransferase